jgi:putative ABC transport system permease protein
LNTALLILRQMRHKRGRTTWTVLAVGLVIICFLLLQTISWAWHIALEQRRDDRIAIWNRTTYALTLPKSYATRAAEVPGVYRTSYATFVEGVDPKSPIANSAPSILAVDPQTYFQVYPESNLAPDQLAAWQRDPHGAVVSRKIANLYGYHLGQAFTIEGKNFPATWHLTVRGIYNSQYRTFADDLMLFHWDYLSEQLRPDDVRRGEISWIMGLVDQSRSLQIAKDVDAHFAGEKVRTQSMTERSMVGMFMSNFSGILRALNLIGGILVLTMALILFNVMTMRIRERKFEFGVLRSIGFSKARIVTMIMGEAALIGFAGGLLGVALSFWLIDNAIGAQIKENMGSLFPYFSVPGPSMVLALFLPVALAMAASIGQTVNASRRDITHLLKDIE